MFSWRLQIETTIAIQPKIWGKKKSGILMLFVAGFCTVFQRKAIIQFIENTKQISVQKIKVARYEENQIKRRIKGMGSDP